MATSIVVNGKTIKRPGVYALTKSGIKYPAQNLSYGNICIIDNGAGAGFAGGAGVSGTLTQGVDSVYEISTIQQYLSFMKGGALWDLGEPLFKPSKAANIPGVSKVYFIKAATTVNAEITYAFENGGVIFQTLDEGLGANGITASGILTKGYACKFIASTINAGKYIVEFYHGSFTGLDPLNNLPYDGILAADSTAVMFLTTPELTLVQDLIDWCLTSNEFKAVFKLKIGYTATGAFTPDDITDNAGYKLATGGTETYDATGFSNAILAIKDLDNTFFLSLDSGTSSTSLSNEKILDFINNESKYEKFMYVAGGYDKTTFAGSTNTSESTAKYYDSDKVVVIHGGLKKTTRNGFILKSQLYKAALVLGRTCGLPPQTPITFKDLNIDGEIHKLSDNEKEFALDFGILTTHFDNELGYHVIQQGINSLQQNSYLVNEDGTSHDIAVRRITAQLNKEICVNAKKVFFGKNEGPNRNTITEEDIKAWLEGFLQTKTASSLEDNLILKFGNINVVVQADNYFASYEFTPNYPISKIVFTGIILEN